MTPDAFWALVDKTDTCWLWQGPVLANGYGRANVAGAKYLTHRYAYEQLVGPIPAGLVTDHLCRVRNCVNPAHLEPVTQKENVARGLAAEARRRRSQAQTHCKQGHPWDESNTNYDNRGWRKCRACVAAYDRQRKQLLREAVAQ